MNILKRNIILIAILAVSSFLNITGLIPNTFFHQNEPGLLGPSDQLYKNIITKLDFDPDIKPDPFKYASILYYTQGFVRGGILFLIYEANKLTGFSFEKPKAIFDVSFTEFVLDNGPQYFEYPMLWAARFFTALLGVGCVYLIYLISIELFRNRTIALFSAAALAVMPLHVRNSHYALADIPQVLFFLLSFLASIKMYKKHSTKSYIVAGFLVGFSSSFKYFPLPLLPFLIFHFLIGWRNFFNKNFFSGLIAIFFGYWLGMPYFFVHSNKIIGFIPYALTWYGPDKLETQSSIFEKLLPKNAHAYHLKFLFIDGMLPIAFITSLSGILVGLKYFTKKTLLTLIFPVANGIFISFYVHQIYEHLSLPMLPFFAIFTGLTAYYFISFNIFKKSFLITAVVLVLYLPSFLFSANASISCSTPITEFQSTNWIRKNVPLKSNFAFEPGARLPSELDINWIKSEVPGDFSLSELQNLNAKYLLVMDGYYGVYLSWSQDLLFPPKEMTDNQYVQLAINEYENSARLLVSFAKPNMCMGNKIYVYEIPPALPPATSLIKEYNLNSSEQMKKFQLLNLEEETHLSHDKISGFENSGAIILSYNHNIFDNFRQDYYLYYSSPLFSELVDIKENNKYTVSALVKPDLRNRTILKEGYLRLDFYNKSGKILKTYLSAKANNTKSWQKLSATAVSPKDSKFLSVGFQSLMLDKFEKFYLDNIAIYAN